MSFVTGDYKAQVFPHLIENFFMTDRIFFAINKVLKIICLIFDIFFQTCMCDTPTESCQRCCRMNLNTSCFVMQPEEMLPGK